MNLIEELNAYLNGQQVLTLATSGPDGIWCCSVFFGYADGRFYFSSKRSTRHARHIANGANVAFAVADSSQTPSDQIIGVQGEGYCRPAGLTDATNIIKHYGMRFIEYQEQFGKIERIAELLKGDASLPYIIEVSRIKFRNKPRFDGERIIEFK